MATRADKASTPNPAATQPLPPPRKPPAPERAAARRRFLDGVLVAVVLAFAFLTSLFPAHNADFFLHAATGRLIAHGQYTIGVDPFAYTTHGATWINTNWLYDLIVYLFYDTSAVGGTILIVLKALMIAVLAEVMLRTAREPGRSLWVPACCVGLAVLSLSGRVQLQPICISILFLGVTYWLLHLPRRLETRAAAKTGPPRRPFLAWWLIPPLCLLWVNLDSWFFLGPITVALFLVGETLQDWLAAADRRQTAGATGARRTLLWVLLVSVGACLVNPHHVWAFTPPSALGLSEAAAVLSRDEQFRPLFISPLESTYFRPNIGLNVAGAAFFPLVVLGLVSFAAGQWIGRWSWERALVWTAFLALAVWRAAAMPFFAVVAGPIASLNFLDFAAKRLGTAPSVTGRAGAWAMGGRILTLLAGVALLVAVWPGWLQAWPQEARRGGWIVEPDPGLVRLTDRIKEWRKADLSPGGRWFTVSPNVLPYLAWYCPGERGGYDLQRLPLYDQAAREIKQVRDSLAFRDGDAGKPDPRWRKVLRSEDVHFLICYEPSPLPLRSGSPLPTLLTSPDEWPLLDVDGGATVFGWQDPATLGASLAGQGRLLALSGLLGGPFVPLERPEAWEAFGSAAAPAPPPASTTPPDWWAAPWTPVKPHSSEADEAAVLSLRYTALQPIWYDRNEVAWKGMWGELKRGWLAEQAGETFGTAWSPYACFPVEVVSRKLGPIGETPPLPHLTPNQGEEVLLGRARRLFDYGPPAPLYLSLRAARRALAVKPDAEAYQVLGEIYFRLVHETREGPFAAMVAYPRVVRGALQPGFPYPLVLRHVQAATALRRALELDPNNIAAERLSILLYQEAGFLDLTVLHGKECVRILRENGAPDAELAREVDQADKELRRRQDTYLLKTANRSVTEQVDVALDMGLRQTALDVLLATDWEKFAGKEPDQLRLQQRELSLMMQTGQVEAVGKELVEDQEKLQSGVGLGMDPDTMLPAYEWLRVEVAAARGDYAEADHWLEEIEKKMRQSAPLMTALPLLGVCGPDEPHLHEPDTRSLTALLVGHLVLRQAPAVNGLWLPLPLSDAGGVIQEVGEPIVEPLGREADLEAIRGWLALEAGDVPAAEKHLDAALEQAPAGEVPFRAASLVLLCRERLNAGK